MIALMKTSTALLACCVLIATLSCRHTDSKNQKNVLSTVHAVLVPITALSRKQFEQDAATVKKRLEALHLMFMKLEEDGQSLHLTFRVPPHNNQGTRILRDVSWLISHTGRWSVHPIAPLPPADRLPREVTRGTFKSIDTLSSARKDTLTSFLDSLGDPYPRTWVLMRETEDAGGVIWHAFLVAPKVQAWVKGSRITYSSPAPAALLLDDMPWTAGMGGSIEIPRPRMFSVLSASRLHVPWKLQQVSSYTSLSQK